MITLEKAREIVKKKSGNLDSFMADAVMETDMRDWDKLIFTEKTSSGENEYVVDTKHEYESYKFRSSNKSRYNILTEERLEEIEDVIYDVNVFEWEECYYLPAEDGSTWSVTIYKDDQVIFKSSGNNAYPEGYDKWKRFLRNFAIHGGGLVGTENGIILNVKHFKK